MKFWKKLVLFITTIISIILSYSRYYIINNNFLYNIENSSKQNNQQHILEKYMLESNVIKEIQLGKKVTYETIAEYLKSLHNYIKDSTELIALYTGEYEKIYSNIEQIENINIKSLLNKEPDNYDLREIEGKHYLLLSSHWSINNKTIYIINAYNVDSIYDERNRQMKDILIIDIITLLISFIIISFFSIFVTRPIKFLNKVSKNISSGKFNERVSIKSKDEIGELAESFNIMADHVENKINELNRIVKQKDDFINGFTHELKTPMTVIMGYSDMLRLKKCDKNLTQKALNYIYSEAKRLESLSFKLMKLMSLSEERIELTEIEIKDFFNKIIKTKALTTPDNEIILDIENYKVSGDIELLEVVIKNLVENAIKAEPKDNKILIKGKVQENHKYRIYVIDKGKGIPKEHIPKVTEAFYMVDKSRSRIDGSSGIGLSLVKKILKLHNSDIFIESEQNVGTTVYFDLEYGSSEEKNK